MLQNHFLAPSSPTPSRTNGIWSILRQPFAKSDIFPKIDSGLQDALLEQRVTFRVQNALWGPKGLPSRPPARPPSQARGRPGRGWGGGGAGAVLRGGGLQYALLAASRKDGPRSGRPPTPITAGGLCGMKTRYACPSTAPVFSTHFSFLFPIPGAEKA